MSSRASKDFRYVRDLPPNTMKEVGRMLCEPQTNRNNYEVLANRLGYTVGELQACCTGNGNPGYDFLHDWSKTGGSTIDFLIIHLKDMERQDIVQMLLEKLNPDIIVVLCVHGAAAGCQRRQIVAKTKKDTKLKDAFRDILAEHGLSPEQLMYGPYSDSSVWDKPASDFVKGEVTFFEKQQIEDDPGPRGRLYTVPARPLRDEETQLRTDAKSRTAFSTPNGDHTKRNAIIQEPYNETFHQHPAKPQAPTETSEEAGCVASKSSSSLGSAGSLLSTGCPSQVGGTGFADSDTGCESSNDTVFHGLFLQEELASDLEGIYLTTSDHIPGYHHELRHKKDCERFLRKEARRDFEYITRPTKKNGILAIGVYTKDQILHFKVQQTITEDGQTVVYIYPNAFTASGITKLLDYYREHPVSNNGSDKGPYLRYPLEKNGSR